MGNFRRILHFCHNGDFFRQLGAAPEALFQFSSILWRRNGRKGEVDGNGESGENRNSGENLPQVWRIFKLDGKRSSLECGNLKEKWQIWQKIAHKCQREN